MLSTFPFSFMKFEEILTVVISASVVLQEQICLGCTYHNINLVIWINLPL